MMSISQETNVLLWERLLDADMSRRYYLRLPAWLTRLELVLSISTAVLSSGAFLSLMVGSSFAWIAPWAALAAAITSTVLTFSKHGKRADLAAGRARQWMEAQTALERLWSRRAVLSDAVVDKALARWDKELLPGAEPLVRYLPLNNRLRDLAYQEVLEARGLAHG
ncbi:MAG: hypothetical protein WCA32_12405 [Chromatiaceae bacterium]|jgi:hypothetical protein